MRSARSTALRQGWSSMPSGRMRRLSRRLSESCWSSAKPSYPSATRRKLYVAAFPGATAEVSATGCGISSMRLIPRRSGEPLLTICQPDRYRGDRRSADADHLRFGFHRRELFSARPCQPNQEGPRADSWTREEERCTGVTNAVFGEADGTDVLAGRAPPLTGVGGGEGCSNSAK